MGEAELAHATKSLIPSLKWLETDLSDAVGRLQGFPTFGDIQQEGAVLQRRRLGRERSIALCYKAGAYGQAPETV